MLAAHDRGKQVALLLIGAPSQDGRTDEVQPDQSQREVRDPVSSQHARHRDRRRAVRAEPAVLWRPGGGDVASLTEPLPPSGLVELARARPAARRRRPHRSRRPSSGEARCAGTSPPRAATSSSVAWDRFLLIAFRHLRTNPSSWSAHYSGAATPPRAAHGVLDISRAVYPSLGEHRRRCARSAVPAVARSGVNRSAEGPGRAG